MKSVMHYTVRAESFRILAGPRGDTNNEGILGRLARFKKSPDRDADDHNNQACFQIGGRWRETIAAARVMFSPDAHYEEL